MRILRWLTTIQGRVTRTVLGLSLIVAGQQLQTVQGLLLMILGLVPLCTALANICLLEDAAHALDEYWRAQRNRPHHPRA